VFVALSIQSPVRMRHMVIYSLSGSIEFFYNGPIFEKKKIIEQEMCVVMSSTTFAETFLVLTVISEMLS